LGVLFFKIVKFVKDNGRVKVDCLIKSSHEDLYASTYTLTLAPLFFFRS